MFKEEMEMLAALHTPISPCLEVKRHAETHWLVTVTCRSLCVPQSVHTCC